MNSNNKSFIKKTISFIGLILIIPSLVNLLAGQSKRLIKDSVSLLISIDNNQLTDPKQCVITYIIQNKAVTQNVSIISNPTIGYKSDNAIQGYFEVEEMGTSGWQKNLTERSDYNYRKQGNTITLKPNQEIQGVINVALFYDIIFNKEYRIRLILYKPNKIKLIQQKKFHSFQIG